MCGGLTRSIYITDNLGSVCRAHLGRWSYQKHEKLGPFRSRLVILKKRRIYLGKYTTRNLATCLRSEMYLIEVSHNRLCKLASDYLLSISVRKVAARHEPRLPMYSS